MEKADHLKLLQCRLFVGVDSNTRRIIMRAAAPLKLQVGQHLFERGDDGSAMYIVLKGRLEIYAISEAGRKVSLNMVQSGDCIGEIGMLDGFARSASVVAQEESILQSVSKATFIEASLKSSTLALNMVDILCDRFRWVSSSVEDFAILSLDRRLARRVLLLSERFSNVDGEVSISQNDLADFAGASREATNKILMEWKACGYIDIRRRTIKLLNKERVDRLANEGY